MTDTDKREELIEAAKRLARYVDAGSLIHTASSYLTSDGAVHLIEFSDLRLVLGAVFEQAHTPTVQGVKNSAQNSDDEREALIGRAQGITENMKASTGDRRGDEWCYIRYRDVDALQAVLAALRRTAVQEPSEAQVVAALDAYDDARTNNLAERGDAMHAALRAAADAGQEEKR